MEDRGARFESRVREVRKCRAQLARRDHRLGRERRCRQGDDVEVDIVGESFFGEAACAEQGAVECAFIHAGRRVDEDLFDARSMRFADRPAGARINRHFTPARDREAGGFELLRKFGFLRLCARFVFAIEVDMARGETFADSDASVTRERAQPDERAIEQDAATVAGDAVGTDAAAMRHLRQGREGLVDQPRARFAVDVRDQPETAAVVLERRVI